MESNNLRDLQNLTNQILSESTQAEEHFMNSWPYTAPYLSEEANVEEPIDEVKTEVTEEADLFDVLSEFLVSEGYSEQEALEMMVIMTEEQRNQILEGIIGQTADNIARGAGTVVGTAQRGIRAAKGLPAYLKQKAKNVKSTFDSARERASSNNPAVRSGRMVRGGTSSASTGTKSQKPNSSVSSPGYDTRRIGGYDLRRLPPN